MAKVLDGTSIDLSTARVAVVVADYNRPITDALLQAALETLTAGGIDPTRVVVVRVPGAWELPQAAQPLAASGLVQAIVCLGAVIKGETTHDQHLNRAISLQLSDLSSRYELPIAMGVLMCNDVEQAWQRSGGAMGNKGQEAAAAVVAMIRNQLAIEQWAQTIATETGR